MAGSSRFDQDGPIQDINVTPLVDVMLVLLIIFMVTATYIGKQNIPVKLPQAASGEADTSSKNLSFALDARENLYLDGQPLALSDLVARVAELKAEHPALAPENWQALISADVAASHGSVVRLIDAVRRAGIMEFGLQVEAQTPEVSVSE